MIIPKDKEHVVITVMQEGLLAINLKIKMVFFYQQ